nr:hypothetical protein Iba_chr14bCG7840 [Ipomoea batatas]
MSPPSCNPKPYANRVMLFYTVLKREVYAKHFGGHSKPRTNSSLGSLTSRMSEQRSDGPGWRMRNGFAIRGRRAKGSQRTVRGLGEVFPAKALSAVVSEPSWVRYIRRGEPSRPEVDQRAMCKRGSDYGIRRAEVDARDDAVRCGSVVIKGNKEVCEDALRRIPEWVVRVVRRSSILDPERANSAVGGDADSRRARKCG